MIAPPGLVLLLSCILVILRLSTAQQCSNAANFTSNSTYAINRNILLSSLASNASANGGFFTATLGQNSDTVYAMALCRGDISSSSCFNCVNSSTHAIMTNCPNQKGATDFSGPNSNYCTVRCYGNSFFGVADALPGFYVWLPMNFTGNGSEFDQALNDLVESLVNRAAVGGSRLKFATGETTYSIFYPLYALVQCVPDLSPQDCGTCLWGAVADYQSCCARNRFVYIMRASCTFQYSLSPFIQSTVGAAPPPPVPAAPPPPPSTNTTSRENNKSSTFHIAIIVVPTSIFLALIVFACAFFGSRKRGDVERRSDPCFHYNASWIRSAAKLFRVSSRRRVARHPGEDATQTLSADSLRFDFATIRAATNDFSNANKLGHGGFGSVYKGKLENGQEIAVKRLAACSEQGEVEFKNEIVLMARLQHKSLVRLLGFCFQGKERLLIYEFVPNSSLDRFIFDPIKRMLLNWETRYKIIIGIAHGLLYLHQDSQLRVIHRDLKAANILLDGDMNPKIADFGIARLFIVDQSKGNTRKIAGTRGYMPPEYANYGQFSVKTDVFSFGVLVLEIVSGKRNGDCGGAEYAEHLISYAWRKWGEGKISSLIDQTMSGGSKSAKMRCIHIGLLCVQEEVAKRPTMNSVVLMLNSVSTRLPLPAKPAFLLQSTRKKSQNAALHDNFPSRVAGSLQSTEDAVNFSVNEASVTEPFPR